MTDNNGIDVGKYQNALSDLCGVDYSYMRGDSAVDAITELISIAIEQEVIIKRQQAEIIADGLIANGVTVQEWISVEDRLPEMGQIVLVSGKRHATSGQFTGTGSDPRHWWWSGNMYKDVTHWMPLPQPPKGE